MTVFWHLFCGRSYGRCKAYEDEWDADPADELFTQSQVESNVETTPVQPTFSWHYINVT